MQSIINKLRNQTHHDYASRHHGEVSRNDWKKNSLLVMFPNTLSGFFCVHGGDGVDDCYFLHLHLSARMICCVYGAVHLPNLRTISPLDGYAICFFVAHSIFFVFYVHCLRMTHMTKTHCQKYFRQTNHLFFAYVWICGCVPFFHLAVICGADVKRYCHCW